MKAGSTDQDWFPCDKETLGQNIRTGELSHRQRLRKNAFPFHGLCLYKCLSLLFDLSAFSSFVV